MGGGRPRASTSGRAAARTLRSASTPPSSPRPLPSFLRPLRHSCAGRNPPHPNTPFPPPSPIHPSPLPGGRLGGGWAAASHHQRPSRRPHPPERIHASVIPGLFSVIPAQAGTHRTPLPPSPRPLPSSPRPLPVIPAQAGTRATSAVAPPSPIHPSPLPGGRLGGGCEAASRHQRPSRRPHLSRAHPRLRHPRAPSRHPCAPFRHSCAGRNHRTPPTSPNSCYARTRTGVPNHASLPATPTPPPRTRQR